MCTGVIGWFMNNYVVMICKVSVVFNLMYLSEVSCKVCKKTIGNLMTINAISQNFKAFATIFSVFPNGISRKPNYQLSCIFYFIISKVFRKNSNTFQIRKQMAQFTWMHICIYYNISSIFFLDKKYFKHNLYRIQEALYEF